MKIGIIYHSHSGITRNVAEKIAVAMDGDLIEIIPDNPYSSISVVPVGCYRSITGKRDAVTPKKIDVSAYDLLIIATPVWAGRETPVIRGGLDALVNGNGKIAYALITCGKEESGNKALISFRADLERHGLIIREGIVLDKQKATDNIAIDERIKKIRDSGDA